MGKPPSRNCRRERRSWKPARTGQRVHFREHASTDVLLTPAPEPRSAAILAAVSWSGAIGFAGRRFLCLDAAAARMAALRFRGPVCEIESRNSHAGPLSVEGAFHGHMHSFLPLRRRSPEAFVASGGRL